MFPDLRKLARSRMERAQSDKRRNVLNGKDFKPYALIVMPGGQVLQAPRLAFDGNKEKRERTRSIAIVCHIVKAAALLIVSDNHGVSLSIKDEPFKTYWEESNHNVKAFETRYMQWLNDNYEGSIANMPREMRRDLLVVSFIGPILGRPMGLSCHYALRGRVVDFEPVIDSDEAGIEMQVGLIPEWWTEEFLGDVPKEAKTALKLVDIIGHGLTPEQKVFHASRAVELFLAQRSMQDELLNLLRRKD